MKEEERQKLEMRLREARDKIKEIMSKSDKPEKVVKNIQSMYVDEISLDSVKKSDNLVSKISKSNLFAAGTSVTIPISNRENLSTSNVSTTSTDPKTSPAQAGPPPPPPPPPPIGPGTSAATNAQNSSNTNSSILTIST